MLSIRKPTEVNIINYKTFRNKLNSDLRKQERSYYNELFNDKKTDMKQKWSVIKSIINKKKSSVTPTVIKINNKEIHDKSRIANSFNNFFINIGKDLAKKIENSDKNPTDYITRRNPHTIFLEPVLSDEVTKIITNLKNSAPGWDGICSKVIKATHASFTIPLLHVLNLSITTGTFPSQLKIAKVLPLFKSGDQQLVSNYRPISILPLFSKILERLIYNRLIKFINKHKLLYKLQFGFREGHSTGMAVTLLVDKIVQALENKHFALSIFLDFSKAFDTVDHSILLSKLELYGIRGLAHNLINNYLSNRKQFVQIDGINSYSKTIQCGVPQGSILGPLLFLIYINDLPEVSTFLQTTVFADDTSAFASGSDIDNLINNANNELNKIYDWLKCNKLSLNINKSHYMIITNKTYSSHVDLKINDNVIEKVSNTKFLGIIIDNKLSWKEHISFVKSKVSRGIGIICKARKSLQLRTLVQLYYSFIYPYLCYGIEVWGMAPPTTMLPLFRLQKRAIKIITNTKRKNSSGPLFKKLKILKLHDLYVFKSQMYVKKYLDTKLPSVFDDMFLYVHNVHNYFTRNRDDFYLPQCRTELCLRSFRYAVIKMYNTLNSSVDYTKNNFKFNLKQFLVDNPNFIPQ
jgi:hypothetical protein